MADGLGAKGFPDLWLGLKELVSDGLGAKGLPDLRLGLALAFVLTTPLATLCIEHILSCPVWRVSLPIARCFTGGTVGSGLSSAVALVLHTLGRIRLLPAAGSGPRGRVSIENIWPLGGLPLPGCLWLESFGPGSVCDTSSRYACMVLVLRPSTS